MPASDRTGETDDLIDRPKPIQRGRNRSLRASRSGREGRRALKSSAQQMPREVQGRGANYRRSKISLQLLGACMEANRQRRIRTDKLTWGGAGVYQRKQGIRIGYQKCKGPPFLPSEFRGLEEQYLAADRQLQLSRYRRLRIDRKRKRERLFGGHGHRWKENSHVDRQLRPRQFAITSLSISRSLSPPPTE